jgi:hypothetical protein
MQGLDTTGQIGKRLYNNQEAENLGEKLRLFSWSYFNSPGVDDIWLASMLLAHHARFHHPTRNKKPVYIP